MISAFAPLCPGFSPLLRQFVRTRCSSLGIASVRPPAPSGRREGKCTAFRIRSGAVHPCGFIPERVEAHAAHSFFRLGQGSAKLAAVPEQFKNSSFTCGHSSPLSPDSLFSIPRWRAAKRIGYEGQKKARAVRFCLPVSCCLCLFWPSLPVGERTTERTDNSHGEPRIARVFWRIVLNPFGILTL